MVQTTKSHGGAYVDFPDGPESYREAAWDTTLRRLFGAAVAHAEDRINWYSQKAGNRAKVAKRIRWLSLVLFAIGTLAPIVLTLVIKAAPILGTEALARIPLTEAGYLLLAAAGALVIFDQFFDASGSWMRFRQSEARLEVLLAELRFGWAELMTRRAATVLDREQAVEFVALLRTFVIKVEMLAEEETKEWARRFNERIDAFDRNPNLKVKLDASAGSEAAGAGAKGAAQTPRDSAQAGPAPASGPAPATARPTVKVRLALDNADKLDEGSLQMLINEAPVATPADGLIELPLEVGVLHRLVATGRSNGKPLRGALELTPTLDDEGRALALELA